MPFNADRFEQAEFRPRSATVEVPALAAFFDAGEKPEWTVRGLNADELHRAMMAPKRTADVEAIVRAIAAGGDKVEAVRKAIGLAGGSSAEIIKRLEMLVLASTAPVIQHSTAAKLAETHPVEFMHLTNVVTELTGQGFDLVKPEAASPQTKDSSPACASPSSEAATFTSCDPT